MHVWIFQTGEPLHSDLGDARPMRAMNLADSLVQAGHIVTLWSSDFFHQEKRHRTGSYQEIKVHDFLRIILVPSLGYQRNIGLGRLIDHAFLAFNLRKALKKIKLPPDVAFIGYPPIEFAYIAVKWLSSQGVPTMLDAKDQWPHIFVEPFPKAVQPFIRLCLWPYFYLGRRVINEATALCSMTPNFLAWMRQFSGRQKSEFDIVIPLSSIDREIEPKILKEAISWWAERGVNSDGRPRIFFVGSISQAFDFGPVIAASKRAREMGVDWQFVICGDGAKASSIVEEFSGISNVIFPGWVDRSKLVALSSMSMIGLAPYRNTDNFIDNMPNKVIDYLSLGMPIASPLKGNVRELIIEKDVGVVYGGGSQECELFDALMNVFNHPEILDKKSKNAFQTYETFFSGEMVYGKLVKNLESLAFDQSCIKSL